MVNSLSANRLALLSTLVWLWAFTCAPAFAAQQLMLGESLTLTLRSEHILQDYQTLDLSAVRQWAHIDDSQQNNERIRLQLTPYHSGEFDIPALHAGGLKIEPQRIRVTPNPHIHITWQAPKQRAWQNEWVSWHIQVRAQDPGLPLSLASTDKANVVFSPQPIQQHIGDQKQAEFVLAQAFNQLGQQTLARPILLVQNRQGGRWIFYPPPQSIEVRPLPSYLPADIGVGRYQLQIKRPFWLSQGQLHTQTLQLSGLNSNQRPNPRTWLQTTQDFEWLTPQADSQQSLSTQGIVYSQTIAQPFRPRQLDWGWYPPIRLTLFNPDTGLLEDQIWPAQPYLVLPYWLQLLAYALALFAFVVLSRWTLTGLQRVYYRVLLHYRLHQAQGDALAIWQAYQSWGKQRGLGEHPTHQAWLNAYQRRFGPHPRLQQQFAQLDQARFGKAPDLPLEPPLG